MDAQQKRTALVAFIIAGTGGLALLVLMLILTHRPSPDAGKKKQRSEQTARGHEDVPEPRPKQVSRPREEEEEERPPRQEEEEVPAKKDKVVPGAQEKLIAALTKARLHTAQRGRVLLISRRPFKETSEVWLARFNDASALVGAYPPGEATAVRDVSDDTPGGGSERRKAGWRLVGDPALLDEIVGLLP